MRLFTPKSSIQPKLEPDHCKVYVLARASAAVPAHGEGSIEPIISWSLAVESPKHRRASQPLELKKNKGFFGSRRRSSKAESTSEPERPLPADQLLVIEYKLEDGDLDISNFSSIFPQEANSDQASLLLKIRIRHVPQALVGTQNLTTRVEQILRQVTSANTHLQNTQGETWIKYALISLQHGHVVPNGHEFNINNLINFAQNKITEFEAEAMSSSHQEGIELVKELNYQDHLDENARLRAMFGHRSPDTFDEEDSSRPSTARFTDASRRSSADGGEPGALRPHGHQMRHQCHARTDPYGGLM